MSGVQSTLCNKILGSCVSKTFVILWVNTPAVNVFKGSNKDCLILEPISGWKGFS